MRVCEKCGSVDNIHEHHLIPRVGWGGTDADGRVLLCKSCHDKVHNHIGAFVGKKINKENFMLWNRLKHEIKRYTLWYIRK